MGKKCRKCVWIVNPFDNLPLEGYRPQRYWLMARAFAEKGHEVTYWTSDFSHATKQRRFFVQEANAGFAVRMVPTLAYPRNICLKRVASHRRLARDWFALANGESVKPDVVIASMPPLGLCDAARRFAVGCAAMFVADVQDAWPETFERIVPKWMLCTMRAKARRIYRNADAISVVASRYIDLAKSYGATAPVKLSYNGIDPGELSEVGDRSSRKESSSLQLQLETPPLRLAYIGSFGASYDLETAIEAVRQTPNVTLDIAGSGPKEESLREMAAGCERIRFHGYLAEAEMKALLRSCDVGLIPMFSESCVGVPGKLADYAAAGLRIVECLGGETRTLVERFRAGAHYEPCNVASLVAALNSPPCGDRDWASFVATFDARRIMAEYVDWVEGLMCCRAVSVPTSN
jgi:glycosyltransferase involved in cell wall biosynthesis